MTRAWLAVLLVSALVGCGDARRDELQRWMAEQRASSKPKITPLSEPKPYVPHEYKQAGSVDPFNGQKMVAAFKREGGLSAASSKLIAPELARRKEALEAIPLDAMAMVGSVNRGGKQIALVRVDRLLYQVQEGNYLGQNYGLVRKISETEVSLREIVQDTTGEWIERPVTLQLQERAK